MTDSKPSAIQKTNPSSGGRNVQCLRQRGKLHMGLFNRDRHDKQHLNQSNSEFSCTKVWFWYKQFKTLFSRYILEYIISVCKQWKDTLCWCLSLWSLTHPASIHRCLALLAALVQFIIAPLPVSILRLVQMTTGAWDSPHLNHKLNSWKKSIFISKGNSNAAVFIRLFIFHQSHQAAIVRGYCQRQR